MKSSFVFNCGLFLPKQLKNIRIKLCLSEENENIFITIVQSLKGTVVNQTLPSLNVSSLMKQGLFKIKQLQGVASSTLMSKSMQ